MVIENFRLSGGLSASFGPDTVQTWHELYFRRVGYLRSLHLQNEMIV
jgi:hypothetical protein